LSTAAQKFYLNGKRRFSFTNKIPNGKTYPLFLKPLPGAAQRKENMAQHHASGPAVWIGLASWLTVTFSAAWVGSRFQPGEWYAGLVKPALTPPPWVFGPVWTLLYLMMGIAAWLVWRKQGLAGALGPLGLFLLQLALNALWSYLFFGLQRPGLAFLDIVTLWLAILAALVAFWRVYPLAGLLLLPYLLWVSFATYLNFQFWRLNP
jgi:benzodiazapine receptor